MTASISKHPSYRLTRAVEEVRKTPSIEGMLACLELCFRNRLATAPVENIFHIIIEETLNNNKSTEALIKLSSWLCRLHKKPENIKPEKGVSLEMEPDDEDAEFKEQLKTVLEIIDKENKEHGRGDAPYKRFPSAWRLSAILPVAFQKNDPAKTISTYIDSLYPIGEEHVKTIEYPAFLESVIARMITLFSESIEASCFDKGVLNDIARAFTKHSNPAQSELSQRSTQEILRIKDVATNAHPSIACAWIKHTRNLLDLPELEQAHISFIGTIAARFHAGLQELKRTYKHSEIRTLLANLPQLLETLLAQWAYNHPFVSLEGEVDDDHMAALELIELKAEETLKSILNIADNYFDHTMPCTARRVAWMIFTMEDINIIHDPSLKDISLLTRCSNDIRLLVSIDDGQLGFTHFEENENGKSFFSPIRLRIRTDSYDTCCVAAFRQGYDHLAVALLSFGIFSQIAFGLGKLCWDHHRLQRLITRGLRTSHSSMLYRAIEITAQALPEGLDKIFMQSFLITNQLPEPIYTPSGVKETTIDLIGRETWLRLSSQCKDYLHDAQITSVRMSLDQGASLSSLESLTSPYTLAIEAEVMKLMAPAFAAPEIKSYLLEKKIGKPTLGTAIALLTRNLPDPVPSAMARLLSNQIPLALKKDLDHALRIRNSAAHPGDFKRKYYDHIRKMIFNEAFFTRLHELFN